MCAVYMSKIMHNGVKADGELQIDQNSSDTVIFAVISFYDMHSNISYNYQYF